MVEAPTVLCLICGYLRPGGSWHAEAKDGEGRPVGVCASCRDAARAHHYRPPYTTGTGVPFTITCTCGTTTVCLLHPLQPTIWCNAGTGAEVKDAV